MDKRRFNRTLTLISVAHSAFSVLTILLIAIVNLRLLPASLSSDNAVFWITVSLIGLVGAFLHFSRKCYVYQITNKYDKIAAADGSANDVNSRVSGYYLYLWTRPLAGLSVGPITTMVILGGLSTISKTTGEGGLSNLSEAGHYVVYLGAFVGGYTSSDLFDALSKFGSSALKPKA